jgi:hypothetical protein
MDETIGVATPYYNSADVLRALNYEQAALAQLIMDLDRTAWLRSALISIVADQTEYDLPGDLLRVKRLELTGESNPQADKTGFYFGRFSDREGTAQAVSAISLLPNYPVAFRGRKLVFSVTPSESMTDAVRLWYYKNPVDMHIGTATSGSASSIVMGGTPTVGNLFAVDDYYNGANLLTTGGTGSDQQVEITDFAGSSQTATATFGTAPDSTTTYEVLCSLSHTEIECLILGAIRRLMQKDGAGQEWSLHFAAEYQNQRNLMRAFRSVRQVQTPIRQRIVCP